MTSSKNIQYDRFNSTRGIVKSMRSDKQDKIKNKLTSHFFGKTLSNKHQSYGLLSKAKCQKTSLTFTARHLNNSLPVRKNMYLWKKVTDSSCSFCLQPETLNHVFQDAKHTLMRNVITGATTQFFFL